jgi:hypothetical protein
VTFIYPAREKTGIYLEEQFKPAIPFIPFRDVATIIPFSGKVSYKYNIRSVNGIP